MPKKDYRVFETEDLEIREEGEKEAFVEGKAIVYNREVEIWPGFMEKIRAGAFSRTIRGHDEVKSFFNHDPDRVLSTTRSTPVLVLDDREDALHFRSPIPPTTYGEDLKINLKRKNVRGASFTFTIDNGGEVVTRDEKGVIHREVISGTLYELGPVTNPAYRQTSAHLRSVEDAYKEYQKRFDDETETINTEVETRRNRLQLQLLNIDL